MVGEVSELFEGSSIRYAFGGALALAQYAEPRGTLDVDVNVFVGVDQSPTVLARLAEAGWDRDPSAQFDIPGAGIRLSAAGRTEKLDLFFSLDAVYEEIADRVRLLPFGRPPRSLPFLSADDLALFKLSFGRDKDWVDLRSLLRTGTPLDLDYIERQLVHLRGPAMYPRLARLRQLARDATG